MLLEEEEEGWRSSIIDKTLGEGDYTNVSRFVGEPTSDILTVKPALADRPVVSRPYTPFVVIAGEAGTIFVSTPLWFTVLVRQPAILLFETPTLRPSDTWFGPSTIDGEACYSSRTYGRLNLENIPIPSYRAITRIQVRNVSNGPLKVERISLPVPYLSLFANEAGDLWTETVTMTHRRETLLDEFTVDRSGPPPGFSLVSPPRLTPTGNMLVRAFSVLRTQSI